MMTTEPDFIRPGQEQKRPEKGTQKQKSRSAFVKSLSQKRKKEEQGPTWTAFCSTSMLLPKLPVDAISAAWRGSTCNNYPAAINPCRVNRRLYTLVSGEFSIWKRRTCHRSVSRLSSTVSAMNYDRKQRLIEMLFVCFFLTTLGTSLHPFSRFVNHFRN